MASMRPLRAPCVPSPCAHFGSLLCVPALRTPVCPYCVHGVLVQFVVDMCVLDPMPAARAHAVRARAVHPRAGRVVHLCSFRPDRATPARQRRRHRGGASARARAALLCAGAVHACVVALASPMLALRVPAVHALAVHACVVRACASHARVACTCCACPCCARPCCAPTRELHRVPHDPASTRKLHRVPS